MPNVVTVAGIFKCSHKGMVHPLQGDVRLNINKSAVVVAGQEVGVSFAPGVPGLIVPCGLSSASGPSPCTATMKAMGGVSVQLTVGGLGVLLSNAFGQAVNPNDPAATWSVSDAGQTVLSVDR